MFTLHLEESEYRAIVEAARVDGDLEHVVVSTESRPNVEVGEDIEIVVGDRHHLGTVVDIVRPKQTPTPADLARLAERERHLAAWFKAHTGVDPATFPADALMEANSVNQWYLVVRHKVSV